MKEIGEETERHEEKRRDRDRGEKNKKGIEEETEKK